VIKSFVLLLTICLCTYIHAYFSFTRKKNLIFHVSTYVSCFYLCFMFYLCFVFLPMFHVSTSVSCFTYVSCFYLCFILLPMFHVSTSVSCFYLCFMFLPMFHSSTYVSCFYLSYMFLPRLHVSTYISCFYLCFCDRICGDTENPTDFFCYTVLPCLLIIFELEIIVSFILQVIKTTQKEAKNRPIWNLEHTTI
jgi:hypothetical protein